MPSCKYLPWVKHPTNSTFLKNRYSFIQYKFSESLPFARYCLRPRDNSYEESSQGLFLHGNFKGGGRQTNKVILASERYRERNNGLNVAV